MSSVPLPLDRQTSDELGHLLAWLEVASGQVRVDGRREWVELEARRVRVIG